jgi:hypothetical protein
MVVWSGTFSENLFKKIYFQLHLFLNAKVNQSSWSINLKTWTCCLQYWNIFKYHQKMHWLVVYGNVLNLLHLAFLWSFCQKTKLHHIKIKTFLFQKVYFYNYIHSSSVVIVNGRSVFETLYSTQPTIVSHQKGTSHPLRNTSAGALTLGVVASCSLCDSYWLQHKHLTSVSSKYIHWPVFSHLSHVFKCVIPRHCGIVAENFACTMDRLKLIPDCWHTWILHICCVAQTSISRIPLSHKQHVCSEYCIINSHALLTHIVDELCTTKCFIFITFYFYPYPSDYNAVNA